MDTIYCHPARAAIFSAAAATGIRHSRLYGRSKSPRVVQTRWACFLVLRRIGLSFTEIAEEFGMHHTNIIHGVCKGTALLRSNSWFSALVDHLSKHLNPTTP